MLNRNGTGTEKRGQVYELRREVTGNKYVSISDADSLEHPDAEFIECLMSKASISMGDDNAEPK